ncbi:MAG: cold shock domain-containing protein [Candidatus Wallbacteria bacterium]|nr:cold shock domain-containing protein [Candidatus Wallbacteria bacterium]
MKSEDESEYPFHFTAIVGRLIKVAQIGEKARFEVIKDQNSGEYNAYNIVFISGTAAQNAGVVAWFDQKTGNGVIHSDDGQQVIFQNSSFQETLGTKLKKDLRVTFEITQVENIDGNLVPKAIKIELEETP